MKFLDSKEQVIDIQLTQHGKRLLSEGTFKPEFYAFYDDDVIYDSDYADFSEDQSETENRILNKTPRLEAQYNFSNIEKKRSISYKYISGGGQYGIPPQYETIETTIVNTLEMDRDFRMQPIGNSSVNSRYAPAWNVLYLNGELEHEDVTTYYTGSASGAIEGIPQLDSEIDIEIVVEHYDLPIGPSDPTGLPQSERLNSFESLTEHGNDLDDGTIRSTAFNDGTMLAVKDQYVLLEIKEDNTEFLKDNFDIEVFKINSTGPNGGDFELEKIYFQEEFNNIKDGILLDDKPGRNSQTLTNSHIEYFFDLLFDEDISVEAYCAARNKDKREDPYIDKELFECPDVTSATAADEKTDRVNIYDIPSDPNEESC